MVDRGKDLAGTVARVLQLHSTGEVVEAIRATGCNPGGVGIMARKATTIPIALSGVSIRAANVLKQEMLAIGGDSAHHRGVAAMSISETEVVLIGTPSQYSRVVSKLRRQPFGLPNLAKSLESALANFSTTRKRTLRLAHGQVLTVGGKVLVMGVLNVTPDSFSDGGEFLSAEAAIARGRRLIVEGADIIDVGGESTRPGAEAVTVREELKRVLPVIRTLSRETAVPISIDTRKPAVAREALSSGASMVNDVGGLRLGAMRDAVHSSGAAAVVMHMRGTPKNMQEDTSYSDLRGEVFSFLKSQTDTALASGIGADQLVVDPGIGFGKSVRGNVDLIDHAGEFRSLGFPVLVGASRKSFLGQLTGGASVRDRQDASVAASVVAAIRGAEIVRVHDVAPTVRALALVEAVSGLFPTGIRK